MRPDLVPNALPLVFMVYYALALALFSQDPYEDVMDNLVGAIEELASDVPAKSSIHAARKRLGSAVLEELFHLVAGQVAGERTAGAYRRGRLVCAIDGFVLDVPESAENREHFGGPSTRIDGRTRPAGYPRARVVTLVEAGTRAVRDAAIGPFATGERDLVKELVGATGPAMIVIMDRGFPGRELIQEFNRQGTAILMRASTQIARADIQELEDGGYLAALWKDSVRGRGEPAWVRVIEYTVDGGERIRLLTNLLDPHEAPGRRAGRAVCRAPAIRGQQPAAQDLPARTRVRTALRKRRTRAPGDLGTPDRQPRPRHSRRPAPPQPQTHPRTHRRPNRQTHTPALPPPPRTHHRTTRHHPQTTPNTRPPPTTEHTKRTALSSFHRERAGGRPCL